MHCFEFEETLFDKRFRKKNRMTLTKYDEAINLSNMKLEITNSMNHDHEIIIQQYKKI